MYASRTRASDATRNRDVIAQSVYTLAQGVCVSVALRECVVRVCAGTTATVSLSWAIYIVVVSVVVVVGAIWVRESERRAAQRKCERKCETELNDFPDSC